MFGEWEAVSKALNRVTGEIIGAAIEVHRILGPGLLESVYEQALCHELGLRGIPFERQAQMPLVYKGATIDRRYRVDVLVDGKVIVDVKAVASVQPINLAQVMTYLKLSGLRLGLILNFNVELMKDGIRRIIL